MRKPARLIVRRLGPANWEEFRQIRLRALAEAPEAFSSTLADALRLDQREWRERLAGRAQFLALTGPISVGTAGGIQSDGCAELISMWVDPSCRRSGVGSRLVDAVAQWARGEGYACLHLWVVAGNHAAERLYTRNGFTRTGKTQAVGASRPQGQEFEMVLRLAVGRSD